MRRGIFLKTCFDGGPSCVGVVGRDDDGYLIADFEAEISDGCVENFVFFAVDLDEVLIVVASERADDGASLDWPNLLVKEFAGFANCELQNIAFDEL